MTSPTTAALLLRLHDTKAVFNFCNGLMFQLHLSKKLYADLAEVAASSNSDRDPVIFTDTPTMSAIPHYDKSAFADDKTIFHGREVRKVPWARGKMGLVLQLSSSSNDPEGWTEPERAGYDGWGHDSKRTWPTGERLERDGCVGFRATFGEAAFTLNHRFYLHRDMTNGLWLSAEDGCEGLLVE